MTLTRSIFIPTASTKIADKASDAVAYVYTSRKGLPAAALFSGKRAKPDAHYSYRTPAERERAVVRHFEGARAVAAHKAAQVAERKAKAEAGHRIEVGHILSASWGYDQTNVNFYQVTAIVGRTMVEVRSIRSMDAEAGDMTGKVLPVSDAFTGEPIRRKVSHRDGVRIDDSRYASVWDGRPMYVSSYA